MISINTQMMYLDGAVLIEILFWLIGGANMRGDNKWPPEEVKKQSDVDNQQRRQLALGPAFRPRRINKVNPFIWSIYFANYICCWTKLTCAHSVFVFPFVS